MLGKKKHASKKVCQYLCSSHLASNLSITLVFTPTAIKNFLCILQYVPLRPEDIAKKDILGFLVCLNYLTFDFFVK